MEYLPNNSTEPPWAYQWIPPSEREEYDKLVGNIDRKSFIADIHAASENFLQAIKMITLVKDEDDQPSLGEIEIDTYPAELFFLYAIEGNPRFLKNYENGQLVESETAIEELDFGLMLSTFMSYNELFSALEESIDAKSAPALDVVLNTFMSRLKLDAGQISDGTFLLSVHELSLLAGMREKSVRNRVHREVPAIPKQGNAATLIDVKDALDWLRGRRKFQESTLPSTNAGRKVLIDLAEEFASC